MPYGGQVDLLKIDVEGYEIQVLGGAPKTLTRTRCILFEANQRHLNHFGYSLASVLTLLADNGFALYRPIGETLAIQIIRIFGPKGPEGRTLLPRVISKNSSAGVDGLSNEP